MLLTSSWLLTFKTTYCFLYTESKTVSKHRMVWGLKPDYALLNLLKKADLSQWELKILAKGFKKHLILMHSFCFFLFLFIHTPSHLQVCCNSLTCGDHPLSSSLFMMVYNSLQREKSFIFFDSLVLAWHYLLTFILGALFLPQPMDPFLRTSRVLQWFLLCLQTSEP